MFRNGKNKAFKNNLEQTYAHFKEYAISLGMHNTKAFIKIILKSSQENYKIICIWDFSTIFCVKMRFKQGSAVGRYLNGIENSEITPGLGSNFL